MNNLVRKVIKKLKERQKKNAVCSFNQLILPPGEKIFLANSCVILKNVSIPFIKDLYTLEESNNWVLWVLDGLNLGVHFYFQITKNIINFVPRLMVLDWPIDFILNEDSLLSASYKEVISRTEIASLPDKTFLIKTSRQKLSDEGLRLCREKNIKIIIRTEENCIWLKS